MPELLRTIRGLHVAEEPVHGAGETYQAHAILGCLHFLPRSWRRL